MSNQPRVLLVHALLPLLPLAAVLGCGAERSVEMAGAAATPGEPPSGKLAFRRGPTNNLALSEIWTMNVTGSGDPRRVTCNNRNDFGPAWSPEGETIAFYSQEPGPTQRTYLIDVNGACAPGTYFADGRFPRWSPDGSQIVLDRLDPQLGAPNRDIFVVDVATGGVGTNLTNHPRDRNTRAEWSPDGSKIAFASRKDCVNTPNVPFPVVEPELDIWVMDANGGDQDHDGYNDTLTRLTHDCAVQPGYGNNAPKWSPDGQKIVFQSTRDGGNFDIYVMDADGNDPTRLTDDPAMDASPDWSPNGTQIAFHSERVNGINQLFIMNADGTGTTQMTYGDPLAPDPDPLTAVVNGFPDWAKPGLGPLR